MATRRARGGKDPMSSLQESVDRLAVSFDRLGDRLEALEGIGVADGDRFTRHIRRYMPFYALASIWVLMLVLLPTRQNATETAQSLGGVGAGGAGTNVAGSTYENPAGEAAGAAGGGASASGSNSVTPGGSTYVPPEVRSIDPLAWNKRGTTRGGFDCGPNIRQLPWSRYAAPCYPAWQGTNNGGATARGVTAKQVTIVERVFPDSANSQAVDAVVQQAGFASQDEREATRRDFEKYMNKTFELWGRQVKVIKYESEYGDSTQEALSQGKEGACADADSIISKYHPFAVIGEGSTAVFGECAAVRKLMVPRSGAYYPESWYRKYHPYLWNGTMECERIAYMNAEYIGKRLAHKPAKWAKQLLKGQPRVFGIFVPDNDEYQHCVNIARDELKKKYNTVFKSRYNYQLDISRFPDEAAKAIVQFNADGVTTVFLACDPISPIFLTQSAAGQEYYPEWILNSAGLTDVEQFARLWDQQEIQWSLFGMSQLGDTGRILGPKGEGTVTYKKGTGTDIPPGAQVEYYSTLGLFSIIQGAGPILNYENVAQAYWRSPPGGAPEFEVGYTSFLTSPNGGPGRDHTAVDDMREVYWLCTNISGDAGGSSRCNAPKSYDGKGGTYVPTYKGRRFLPGQFPKGDPPVFPEYTG